MPKLTDKERVQVDRNHALRKAAFDDYTGPKYMSHHCRVCSWSGNGTNFDEARQIIKDHERIAHPALVAWDNDPLPMRLTVAAIHDHDCVIEPCPCICGCGAGPGCVLIFGPLCTTCMIRANRGDRDHDEPK